jgi:riboflavin kinase/FMN adenylyltransferase
LPSAISTASIAATRRCSSRALEEAAAAHGVAALVLTFEPHPRQSVPAADVPLFRPHRRRRSRRELIEALGFDAGVVELAVRRANFAGLSGRGPSSTSILVAAPRHQPRRSPASISISARTGSGGPAFLMAGGRQRHGFDV